MPHASRQPFTVDLAHEQRRTPSRAETMLWAALRGARLGVKFRRQVPMGRYVADFVCHERMLIVEADGPLHDDPASIAHDRERDVWFKSQGYRVLRLPNDLVIGAPELAVQRIVEALAKP